MARDGEVGPLEQLGALVAQAREVEAPVVSAWAVRGLEPLEQLGRWISLARETPSRVGARAPLRGVMVGVDEARMMPELPAAVARAGVDPHRALLEVLRAEAASIGGRKEPLGRDWPELFPKGTPAGAPAPQPPAVTGHTVMLRPGVPSKRPAPSPASARADEAPVSSSGVLGTAAGSEDEVVLGELLGALASAPLPGRARALVAEIIARAIHDPSPQELRRALAIVVTGEVR